MNYVIKLLESSDDEALNQLRQNFSDAPIAKFALEWTKHIHNTSLNHFDYYVLQVFECNVLKSFGILHICHEVDLSPFLGKTFNRLFSFVKIFNLDLSKINIGYISIPLFIYPGVFFKIDDPKKQNDIYKYILNYITEKKFGIDILCFFTLTDHKVKIKKILKIPFLPDTVLKLPYENINEYIDSLPKETQRLIRRSRRKANINNIELIYYDKKNLIDSSRIFELYEKTINRKRKNNNVSVIPNPIKLSEQTFARINEFTEKYVLNYIKYRDEIVGFSISFKIDKCILSYKFIGIDYDKANMLEIHTNLHLQRVEYAIENKYTEMHMGPVNYDSKIRLGAKIKPTICWLSFYNPILKLISIFLRISFKKNYLDSLTKN